MKTGEGRIMWGEGRIMRGEGRIMRGEGRIMRGDATPFLNRGLYWVSVWGLGMQVGWCWCAFWHYNSMWEVV